MAIGRVPGQTGIQPSIVTAKGDLIVATASGSVTNQSVGSNNQVLTADSAQADGVKWANGSAATLTTTGDIIYASAANTPARLGIGSTGQALTVSGGVPAWATLASGGWTLDSTTTLSGSSTSINLPSGYRELKIFIVNYNLSADAYPSITFNSSTTGLYANLYLYGTTTGNAASAVAETALYLGQGGVVSSGANNNNAVITFENQDSTTGWKNYIMTDISEQGGTKKNAFWAGFFRSTSAVTTIQIKAGAQTWSGGTVLVYGVK